MKVLFDLGHPAHVHLFRNAAKTLGERGHEVTFAIRDKPIIKALLQLYGAEPIIASRPRSGIAGLAWEMVEHDYNVLRLTRKHRFDVLAGTSVAVAHVSQLTNAKSAVFSEDDAQVVPLFAAITYPFANKVVVPAVLTDKRRRNYVCHSSYHELAYLHPNHFKPDPTIKEELQLSPQEQYFIIRLVAFQAHHDTGHSGISEDLQHKLVRLLSQYGRVFITAEGEIPSAFREHQMYIPPDRMHDAMAFARLLISDSQTMTAEAAVLGIPAIRCNSFIGRLSYLHELEHRYELAYAFSPSQGDRMLETIRYLLANDVKQLWQEKRQRMLAEKVDFHSWMVEFFENLHEGR